MLEEGDAELGGSPAQLDLFGRAAEGRPAEAGPSEARRAAAEAAVLATLREIDPDRLTPIEALAALANLRRLAAREDGEAGGGGPGPGP